MDSIATVDFDSVMMIAKKTPEGLVHEAFLIQITPPPHVIFLKPSPDSERESFQISELEILTFVELYFREYLCSFIFSNKGIDGDGYDVESPTLDSSNVNLDDLSIRNRQHLSSSPSALPPGEGRSK